MKWFIAIIEEFGVPDSWIWNPIKFQSENEITAIDFIEKHLLEKGVSKERWEEDFELIDLYDCGEFEPVDLR